MNDVKKYISTHPNQRVKKPDDQLFKFMLKVKK